MKRLYLLLLLACGTLFGQSDSINKLDEIILRGNFSPVMNSGYRVRVIADSILRNNYESLGNLLQKQANFYFRQNGNGMVSSISLRGTSASQTGVYWNGIGINSALNGQTDFNTIQANSFDEIEVRKGGGSVLLGNGSIGGAINLKDRLTFERAQRAQLLVGAGSYDTYFSQLTASWATDNFYGKVSGGVMSSANDYPYHGTDLKNDNGAFLNYNINATFGYQLNELHTLKLNASVFDNDRELSRTLTSVSNSKLKNDDRRLLLDWTYLGERLTSSLKMAYLFEDFHYLFDQDVSETQSFGKSNRLIAKYDLSYFIHNNLFFRAGLEFENAIGEGTNISSVSQDDFTAYLLMHHEPVDRLTYNVSFRAGVSSAYEIPFIYSLDTRYLLTKELSVRAAFSTNYRLPTFNDLYWEPGGNPDLKPEHSNSGELGLDYQHKTFKMSAGGYMIKSKDLIQWRPVTQDFWRPENVSEALNYGLEFLSEYSRIMGDHTVTLNASYDYTIAKDEELDKQLIYVPKHRAGAILNYAWRKWQFSYNLQYIGKVYTTTSNTQDLDDYLLSDISFYSSFFKDLLGINFKVNNLFDVNYQSVAYRPMPNRNYVIQINIKL